MQFFEEKYKEELENRNNISNQYMKLEENYKKTLREKALIEQDLLNNRNIEKNMNFPINLSETQTNEKKTIDKLNLKIEDLSNQNSGLNEKNSKLLK